MQTVPCPRRGVHFNDQGEFTGIDASRGGMPDELSAAGQMILADDGRGGHAPAEYEPTAEDWQAVADVIAEATIGDADTLNRDALAKLQVDAIEALGGVPVRTDRTLILGHDGAITVQWGVIAGPAIGIGKTPAAALDCALGHLDASKSIKPIPTGGYRVAGLASVLGAPFRSDVEALKHARRVAADPAYLDAALVWQCPGITDLRQQTPAPSAA
jgi:hypothetical protein